ncbi:MAG TPA: glycosyltransferase [Methanofastidiosum sp.]|nr:glycosyltransferase [Methanofastidiosum sp.]
MEAQKYLCNLIEDEEKNPKVSIIIPVYNGSNYLTEAIDSALKQTYKNIEIIVVNDGSSDDGATERIAMKYKNKIKYFSKPNGGTSTALNVGIKHMTGDYFSWLSHDDQYYPKKIQRQIEELRKLKDKNTIMMTDLDGIDENYKMIYKTSYIKHIEAYPPREKSFLHPIIYNQTHGCTLLIPKACFDEVGLFDENEKVAQDFEFFYRAFSKFPHKLMPEILVTARDSSNRQGRRSKAKGNEEYSRLYIKMIESLSEEDYKLLAPSKLEFYEDMMFFFDSAGYTYAWDFVSNLLIKNLQISSYDLVGNKFNGHDLHKYLREKGISSKQMVLYKESDDPNTFQFDFMAKDSSKYLIMQKEFFNTDIVHLHLVHNILDFNYLPMMTRLKPTVITLHDPFFLSGHCVHHFDCEKWQTHCQDCPYLDSLFPLEKDFTALNFELRRKAVSESNISVIVASKWMEEKVKKSPIWKDKKVFLLPFGVNQDLFKPSDTKTVREELGIPRDNIVIMFRANNDVFKGIELIKKALKELKSKRKITLITVDKKEILDEFRDRFDIKEYGWVKDDNLLAKLYQSIDIFLMPSKQETFGLMAVEAMSCGKTVLSIKGEGTALPGVINSPECGICVEEENFSKELQKLIMNPKELSMRGEKSLKYARKYYSKEIYIEKMIDIYKEVMGNHKLDKESELIISQFREYLRDGINIPMSIGYSNNGSKRRINKYWKESSFSRKIYRTFIPLEGRKIISKVFQITLRQVKRFVPKEIKERIKR